MTKRTKLIIVDLIFLTLDIMIGYGLFGLWFWLFDNQFVLTVLVIVTVIGLGKQGLKLAKDLFEHLRLDAE